jgi:hypothetical protein
VLTVSASVVSVPVNPLVPLQSPEAVHELALLDDHVSVEVSPLAIDAGFSASDTVGPGWAPGVWVISVLLAPQAARTIMAATPAIRARQSQSKRTGKLVLMPRCGIWQALRDLSLPYSFVATRLGRPNRLRS